MKKVIVFVSTTLISSLGWWLGSQVGFITACYLSILGMGIGLYIGRKVCLKYEDYL